MMKLTVELYQDDQTGQWGYGVPALSIVGTGCLSRAEAEEKALEAIRFTIESYDQPDKSTEVLEFEIEIKPHAAAS